VLANILAGDSKSTRPASNCAVADNLFVDRLRPDFKLNPGKLAKTSLIVAAGSSAVMFIDYRLFNYQLSKIKLLVIIIIIYSIWKILI
jgi:hypothetical protein